MRSRFPEAGGWSVRRVAAEVAAATTSIVDGAEFWELPYWVAQVIDGGKTGRANTAFQAALLRDTSGNPFRPVTLDPALLRWNDGAIPKQASAIYEGQAFDRLPSLANTLEEAGCGDAEILAHCRSGTVHIRGCWLIDALLGKS